MAQLAPPPLYQFFDANGAPLAGGQLWTYEAGSTTPLETFTDSSGGTPNTNPIILDANGECTVWMGPDAYKFVLEDSDDVVQWTRDNIQFIPDGSITTVMLADGSVTVAKMDLSDLTSADLPDNCIGTLNIEDDAVTASKIPDASIPTTKLVASTEIGFGDLGDPRFGIGPMAFPKKPWAAPTLIAVPSSPLLGDGNSVAWSRTGKILAVAENNTEVMALFSRFGNTLTRMANPTATSVFPGDAIALSPDGQYLAVTSGNIGCSSVFLYQRQGNSWGAILSLQITLAHGVTGLDWSADGRYLAATFTQTPYIHVWELIDVALPWGIRYESQNGQSVGSNHILNYETKVWDGMSAVLTGGGWIFVAYREGIHRFNAAAVMDFTSGSPNPCKLAVLYTNGVTSAQTTYVVDLRTYAAGTGVPAFLAGSIELYMQQGDFVSIEYQPTAVGALESVLANNWVTIMEGDQYEVLNTFNVLSNPATLPAGPAKCVKWSPDRTMLAVGHNTLGYSFTVTSANATLGATYTNNGNTYTVTATIAGATTLTASGTAAPLASGTLTKTGGTGDSSITFSAFTVPQTYLSVYAFDGTTLTKISDPATLPAGQVNGLDWSPDSTLLTAANTTTPFMITYQISKVSGITLTALAPPGTLPAGDANGVAYSHDGTKVAIAHNASPFVSIYDISGTTFTKEADPSGLPTGNGKSVSWTPDDQYLTVGHVSSPYMTTLQTSGEYAAGVAFIKEVNLV